jgi:hypothetical protein
MNRNQILFYATAQDLSGALSSLEAQKGLQYTLAGMFDSKELQTYLSYRDIPDLGRAFHRSAVANRRYLVSLKGTVLRIRDVPQNPGGVLFAVDLRLNEDSIVFSPGGRHRDDVMLYGMIGTLSPPSVASKNLYTYVAKAFRKDFTKAREYFVGPEALDLMASGVRLTLDATTPPEFDLNCRRLPSARRRNHSTAFAEFKLSISDERYKNFLCSITSSDVRRSSSRCCHRTFGSFSSNAFLFWMVCAWT